MIGLVVETAVEGLSVGKDVDGVLLRKVRSPWLVVRIATALIAGVLAMVFVLQAQEEAKWTQLTETFVEQLNALGSSLPPGGADLIHLPSNEADELIIVGLFLSRDDLARKFPGRPQSLLDSLFANSQDDRQGPTLVWLKRGQILSITHAMNLKVGLNFSVKSWDLQGDRAIRVRKELTSTNAFLSLFFES